MIGFSVHCNLFLKVLIITFHIHNHHSYSFCIHHNLHKIFHIHNLAPHLSFHIHILHSFCIHHSLHRICHSHIQVQPQPLSFHIHSHHNFCNHHSLHKIFH